MSVGGSGVSVGNSDVPVGGRGVSSGVSTVSMGGSSVPGLVVPVGVSVAVGTASPASLVGVFQTIAGVVGKAAVPSLSLAPKARTRSTPSKNTSTAAMAARIHTTGERFFPGCAYRLGAIGSVGAGRRGGGGTAATSSLFEAAEFSADPISAPL